MILLLQLVLLVVILYITYRYWILFQMRKKISWMPSARLLPFLGSSLEFGSNTVEILEKMDKLVQNPAKSVYFETGISEFGIATKDAGIMEFLLSSNKEEMLVKSDDYRYFLPWLGTGLITSNGKKWKKRRRIITPAFHFSILEQFVDVFESNGNILVQKLKKEALDKESVNVYSYVTFCVLDIISESAMGVSIKSQEGNNKEYVDSVKAFCRIATERTFSPIFGYDILFRLSPDYKTSKRCIEIMHDFTNAVINNRVKKIIDKGNPALEKNSDGVKPKLAFLDLILNSTIDGEPLNKEDIREEVDTFMFAGHDTTSFAISMTLYLLATHPEIQAQARNEQREMFGQNRDGPVTMHDLNNMKYLDLIIKESLRLYPPVPVIGRTMAKDVDYKGNIIPKGTLMSLFIYGTNRDPDYHEKAEEFIPERHLNSTGKHFSYIPFSAGPRNCIGQKFALLEMKSIISRILRNFEVLPANPEHKPILVIETLSKPLNGVNIKLRNYEWK